MSVPLKIIKFQGYFNSEIDPIFETCVAQTLRNNESALPRAVLYQ